LQGESLTEFIVFPSAAGRRSTPPVDIIIFLPGHISPHIHVIILSLRLSPSVTYLIPDMRRRHQMQLRHRRDKETHRVQTSQRTRKNRARQGLDDSKRICRSVRGREAPNAARRPRQSFSGGRCPSRRGCRSSCCDARPSCGTRSNAFE